MIAVFFLWSEIGGQVHLDLMPWYLKVGLGGGAALAVVKATRAAVNQTSAWSGPVLRWLGLLLLLLIACGVASYYYHMCCESDEDDQDSSTVSWIIVPGSMHG
ncbi:MAG: hypothetical protein ACLQVN_03895 [Bryobacteraceae bacterium]